MLRIAAGLHPRWDQQKADELVALFDLPLDRKIKKLSRGQLSAIGIVTGIASRADLTFFDEPYLGLDAVARKNFYDELLADYAEYPRTIVISSHHIDEVAPLLETVTVIDDGELLMQRDIEDLADAAFAFAGTRAAVDEFAASVDVIERTDIGGLSTIVVSGPISSETAALAKQLRLDKTTASLQDLFVAMTESARKSRLSA